MTGNGRQASEGPSLQPAGGAGVGVGSVLFQLGGGVAVFAGSPAAARPRS